MEKINIAELLKDCPQGMELDCVLFDDVVFDEIDDDEYCGCPIVIKTKEGETWNLTSTGCWDDSPSAKCVIFPKGKTTWEGFVPPCKFEDGDIITDSLGTCIFKGEGELEDTVDYYCGITDGYFRVKDNKCNPKGHYGYIVDYRLSTEKEKQKLFAAIKEHGYKWNAETKNLEKLIEPKFDITTLKPFDKVLVRDKNTEEWRAHFFSHYRNTSDRPYICIGTEGLNEYKKCIPFKGNEYLLGKTDDCQEFYKTWE